MSTKSTQEAVQVGVATSSDNPEAEFPLFKHLPIEIRQKIWGFAVPDPAIVVQCESFNANVRFRYVRDGGKVPGVLHACRESRAEFLEKDDGQPDPTLARRRAAHPLYKLYFIEKARSRRRTTRTTGPVFFSIGHDIFWGKRYAGIITDGRRRYHDDDLSGIGLLDIAPGLKHLVISYAHSCSHALGISPELIMRHFPSLEYLTLLIPDNIKWYSNQRVIRKGPEVDGQLDVGGLSEADQGWFKEECRLFDLSWAALQQQFPGKHLPAVKFRFESQFIENEGILTPTRPEDPLAEFDI